MFKAFLSLCALLVLSGCLVPRQEELDRQAQEKALREREQRRMIEEYQQRTQMSLQDSEAQLLQIQREVRTISEEMARAQARDIQQLEQRITRLEGSIRELDQRRQKDREEIIDILSKRMAEVFSQQQQSRATAVQSGGSHVVAAGENIGSIAAAYGTTSRALIQANNLSNPNSIRVGQRLVIPR